MPKWYLNPDGTFPTDADGKPMFVSEADFLCCCCGECSAPSECPCASWPPPSWPCGGLLEEYTAEGAMTDQLFIGNYEYDTDGPVILPATGRCAWGKTGHTGRRRTTVPGPPGAWESATLDITLTLSSGPARWRVRFTNRGLAVSNGSIALPPGTYTTPDTAQTATGNITIS